MSGGYPYASQMPSYNSDLNANPILMGSSSPASSSLSSSPKSAVLSSSPLNGGSNHQHYLMATLKHRLMTAAAAAAHIESQQNQQQSEAIKSAQAMTNVATNSCNSSSSNSNNRANRFFPDQVVDILNRWFVENVDYPYPDEHMTHLLAKEANISAKQVRKWFANKRVRSNKCFKQTFKIKRTLSLDTSLPFTTVTKPTRICPKANGTEMDVSCCVDMKVASSCSDSDDVNASCYRGYTAQPILIPRTFEHVSSLSSSVSSSSSSFLSSSSSSSSSSPSRCSPVAMAALSSSSSTAAVAYPPASASAVMAVSAQSPTAAQGNLAAVSFAAAAAAAAAFYNPFLIMHHLLQQQQHQLNKQLGETSATTTATTIKRKTHLSNCFMQDMSKEEKNVDDMDIIADESSSSLFQSSTQNCLNDTTNHTTATTNEECSASQKLVSSTTATNSNQENTLPASLTRSKPKVNFGDISDLIN